MNLQFRLATLFGIVTFLSISLGGMLVAWDWLVPVQREQVVAFFAYFSPFWLPAAVAAYGLARRSMSWRYVLTFAVTQGTALALMVAMEWLFQ